MFQLRAGDYCTGCAEASKPHLHVDWQIDSARSASAPVNGGRTEPKGDKSRIVPVWEFSFTGFPLREAVEARAQAARAEQESGTNPQALLFPDTAGGLLWHTSFQRDLLLPAMEQAGWPVDVYDHTYPRWDRTSGTHTTVTETHREAVFSWHSLRHRFARTCIDVKKMPKGALMAIGGWENPATVDNRYYRSGADNMKAGIDDYA